ncbi:MAG: hypothetical protein JNK05_20205 [Myxococcales bacterium]|nr:hypothetical protein [Myxococcales bacterium]
MDDTDLRSQWLDAIRRSNHADEARLFERPPWNNAVRALSSRVREAPLSSDDARSFVIIESTWDRDETEPRGVEVDLLRGDAIETRRIVDFPEELRRWDPAARPLDSVLVATLLHDLKNALGAQSLLLGSAERELRVAAESDRPARVPMLLDTVQLCRESVTIAADRAQIAQILSSHAQQPTVNSELWLRLSVAALGDERDRIERVVSPESRVGPIGDCRAIVSVSIALAALTGAGLKGSANGAIPEASVRCEGEGGETLRLEIYVPSRRIELENVWRAARRASPSATRGRNEALVGLAEALDSRERFRFESDASKGTRLVVFGARSSGILR